MTETANPNPLNSPFIVLSRAKKKLIRLNGEIKNYFSSDYLEDVKEYDEEYECFFSKLRIKRGPPDEIGDLAEQLIWEQRRVLDHTAAAAARLSGAEEADIYHIAFPSGRAEQFENVVAGKCKGMLPEFRDLFHSFSAYPGGNNLLYDLGRIRNTSGHRIVVPVGTLVNVDPGYAEMKGRPKYIPSPRWDYENQEIIYVSEDKNGRFGYDAKAHIDIRFHQIKPIEGRSVMEFLNGAHGEVFKVFESTLYLADRLGLADIHDF